MSRLGVTQSTDDITYNLDYPPGSPPPYTKRCLTLNAEAYMEIYFATVHVAYPFLYKDEYYNDFPKLYNAEASIGGAKKATFCIVKCRVLS